MLRELSLQEKQDDGVKVKTGAQAEAKEKRLAQERRAMVAEQLQQANVQLAVSLRVVGLRAHAWKKLVYSKISMFCLLDRMKLVGERTWPRPRNIKCLRSSRP